MVGDVGRFPAAIRERSSQENSIVGEVVDAGIDGASRRGRRVRATILIAIAATGFAVWRVAAIPADHHAAGVAHRVRDAVASFGYDRLSVAAASGGLGDLNRAAGTSVWVFLGRPVVVKAEASQWWTFWQPRCVVVSIGRDGRAHSSVVKTPDCLKAPVPAAWKR